MQILVKIAKMWDLNYRLNETFHNFKTYEGLKSAKYSNQLHILATQYSTGFAYINIVFPPKDSSLDKFSVCLSYGSRVLLLM